MLITLSWFPSYGRYRVVSKTDPKSANEMKGNQLPRPSRWPRRATLHSLCLWRRVWRGRVSPTLEWLGSTNGSPQHERSDPEGVVTQVESCLASLGASLRSDPSHPIIYLSPETQS
jgi:hypothetical protein